MKSVRKLALLSVMVLFLAACSTANPLLGILASKTPEATNTPSPSPTPERILSVSGTIGELSDRMITLCKVIDGVNDLPAECVVHNESVTSQTGGAFEFYNVPAGTYFLLYDTGDLDAFSEGMQKWSGNILKLGDAEWLETDYYPADVEVTLMMPIGTPMSWMSKPQYLYSYNYLALHGNGPFALAHNPKLLDNGKIVKMIHPVVVVIEDGTPVEVKINAYKFKMD